MDRERLKEVLLLQHRQKKERGIPRTLRAMIEQFKKTPFVIIISGVRRCGKSTLLAQLSTKKNYFVNFDDERFLDFTVKDFQMLVEVLQELFGKREIFFFDEIQNIKGWERFVRRLHDNKKKVYITGSNASMLSQELGTHLTGRNISLQLFPFSFREFVTLQSKKKPYIKLFTEYLKEGGFPEYLETRKEEYLKNLYENILYRDIITRYKLPSEKPLRETVYFVASNIGKEISFNSIRKLTGLSSATTIREYFAYLENSYLIFLISRYDPSLKKQTYANKKAYFIDTRMAETVGFRTSKDEGRLLENLVFLQLKREGKEIFFHKGEKECDFLIREGSRITAAIQVTTTLGKNSEREVEGLWEAMRKYKLREGLLLTMDEEKQICQGKKRIHVMPVWKWVLQAPL